MDNDNDDNTAEHTVASTRVASPVGPLVLGASSKGVVRLSFSTDAATNSDPTNSDASAGNSDASAGGRDAGAERWLRLLSSELTAYFSGALRQFSVPIDWSVVTGARLEVLRALYTSVGYRKTTTYGRLASTSGHPGAARLVGTIMGSNPIAIVVPCHRVLAGDGSLGGYGPGVPLKRQLLELEGSLPATLFD